MGIDAENFLTMTAVVLGLFLGVGLLRTTFRAAAIPAPERRGRGRA